MNKSNHTLIMSDDDLKCLKKAIKQTKKTWNKILAQIEKENNENERNARKVA